MAVLTQAELIAKVATNLASGSNITAAEHRDLENDIIDTMFSLRPYKVYTALLTQTGTNAPVATILENTLGATPVWTYSSTGDYICTLSGAFVLGKTFLIPPKNFFAAGIDSQILNSGNANEIELIVFEDDTLIRVDDMMVNSSIEIRVYP